MPLTRLVPVKLGLTGMPRQNGRGCSCKLSFVQCVLERLRQREGEFIVGDPESC